MTEKSNWKGNCTVTVLIQMVVFWGAGDYARKISKASPWQLHVPLHIQCFLVCNSEASTYVRHFSCTLLEQAYKKEPALTLSQYWHIISLLWLWKGHQTVNCGGEMLMLKLRNLFICRYFFVTARSDFITNEISTLMNRHCRYTLRWETVIILYSNAIHFKTWLVINISVVRLYGGTIVTLGRRDFAHKRQNTQIYPSNRVCFPTCWWAIVAGPVLEAWREK